jgi:hypothetical protein
MAFGTLLLLSIVVFTVGKKEEISISSKKRNVLSCGPVQSANGHNSWPGNENSGNGCSHQTVSAALLNRLKRDKMHSC